MPSYRNHSIDLQSKLNQLAGFYMMATLAFNESWNLHVYCIIHYHTCISENCIKIKINLNFYSYICGSSKGFLKVFKTFSVLEMTTRYTVDRMFSKSSWIHQKVLSSWLPILKLKVSGDFQTKSISVNLPESTCSTTWSVAILYFCFSRTFCVKGNA